MELSSGSWSVSTASVFDKLNLKQQQEVLVVNAPSSFETELLTLQRRHCAP